MPAAPGVPASEADSLAEEPGPSDPGPAAVEAALGASTVLDGVRDATGPLPG
ncbi:hypothetical protein [Cellulomonas denverensis]|uniref:hypothetical protein n=1 Tax=Cellulomonas denverensis TaxID=264297 RepID=UPI0019437844|nr:hypothetical protein [Cellulomonas denverensis]